MAVFRINKTGNFTVMSNTHLKEKAMSLKAKGLLSVMLSLPDEWDYSIAGLEKLSDDGEKSTRKALNELEKFGYLVRKPIRADGKIRDWEYQIFEEPQNTEKLLADFVQVEKAVVENAVVEKGGQSSTNTLNTKELNKEGLNVEGNSVDVNEDNPEKIKKFIPPKVEEVAEYVATRKTKIDPQHFIDHYTANGWMVGKTKMKDWKAAVRTWERNERKWNERKKGEDYGEVSADVERIAANIGVRC